MEENFAGGQRKPLEPRRRARNQQVFHASACSQYNNSRINDRLTGKTSAAAKFLSRPADEPGQFYLANHNNGLKLQSNSFIQQQHRSCSKSNLEGGRKFDNRDGRRKKSDHYEDEQQASFPIVCLREAAGAVEMPVDGESRLRHADHDRVVVVARQDSQRGSSNNIIINSPIEPNSSNGSLKSTCDSNGSSTSSGFCSTSAEAITESQVRKSNCPPSDRLDYQSSCGPFGSLKHQLGLRNKVIDDLDRLLTEANKSRSRGCPSSSPTDSHLSSGQDHSPQRSLAGRMFANSQDSTLTRAHEVDYSTLCRDDFSSFISPQINENQNQPDFGQRSRMLSQQQQVVSEEHLIIDRCAQMDRPYGPTLIGVHENSSHPASNYSETPTSGESEEELAEEEEEEDSLVDPAEFVTQSSSSSCLSGEQSNQSDSHSATAIAESDNGQEENSIHKELSLMVEESNENNFRSVSPLKLPTSELYATYSNKIEALLGLSRNETSAPPTPAARAKTPNELIRREPQPRYIVKFRDKSQEVLEITQEIEFVREEEDEEDGESGLLVQRIAHGENFENIVTTPQVTPSFDWDATVVPIRQVARALTKAEAAAFEESLIECFAESHLSRENVIKIVKSHLGSFFNNYAIHQARVSELAAGWQENWLFASKRAGDPQSSTAKRSRMDESLDLTKYSTLLNQDGCMRPKFKPPMNYLGRSALFCEPSNPASNLVESIYGAQAERKDELKEVAVESLGQPDVCRMLPNHLDEKEIEPNRSGLAAKPLEVFYDMSSLVRPTKNKTDKFSFSSYGYLFKSSSLPATSNMEGASRVEGLILDTFQRMLTTNNHLTRIQEQLTSEDRFESERVKFLIGLTDVELTTDLRVIQFCSKISGSLPIRVRWYKLSGDGLRKWIEISSTTSSSSTRIRLREASCLRPKLSLASKSSRWPIELCASSDYEYQTEASSWFRFKRSAGDILFEIREPSHEHDLGQTYRCVLENYCSREECSFKLSRRPAGVAASSCKAKPTVAVNKVNYNGKPILRTWSQRTLHKPKPSTTNLPLELRQESRPSELVELSLRRERRRAAGGGAESQPDEGGNPSDANGDKNANKAAACRQQSLGQRSTQMLRESSRDNFGDHFPYHPANLLKRLEANKFSTLSYRTLSKEAKVSQRETPSQHDRSHPQATAFVPATLESDRNDSLAANFRNSFVAIAHGEEEKVGKENDGPIASRRRLTAVAGQPADVNRGKLVFQRQPPPARPRLGLDL